MPESPTIVVQTESSLQETLETEDVREDADVLVVLDKLLELEELMHACGNSIQKGLNGALVGPELDVVLRTELEVLLDTLVVRERDDLTV